MLANKVESVLVVGAGPTGLAAAVALRSRGVAVRIIDATREGANTSRAAVVHARTLEALEPLGVTARILQRAVRVPRFEVRDGNRTLAAIDFSSLPTAYPFTAMISQTETEAFLRERLAELGAEVAWGHAFQALEQTQNGAVVTVGRPDGGRESLSVDAVIGADGMRSSVRDAVGIDFPGAGYEQSFLLADVTLSHGVSREVVSLTFAPAGLVVIAPLPDERFRIVATMDDAPQRPDLTDIQSLLDSRAPGGRVSAVVWSGRFRVHHRLAATYRSGRVFLAGDAAHVHSPAGGQGMNTGIQDGLRLAEILSRSTAFDDYERSRRPVAERVVRLTDRMTRAASVDSGLGRAARNTAIRIGSALPPIHRRLAMEISELAYR